MSQLREYLPYARAIMIFPSVLSGGFLLGLKGGTGLLVARRGKGWSDPGFVRLRGVSFGFQIGGEKTEAMFLIMTEKGLDAVSSDNIKLGADVGVAALSKGISASAATTASATDIYSFGSSSGLFAGISIEGARLEQGGRTKPSVLRRTPGKPRPDRAHRRRFKQVSSRCSSGLLRPAAPGPGPQGQNPAAPLIEGYAPKTIGGGYFRFAVADWSVPDYPAGVSSLSSQVVAAAPRPSPPRASRRLKMSG